MNKFKDKDQKTDGHLINELIKTPSIVVIDEASRNLGELPRLKALTLAQEARLDLVQVGEKDGIPIAKIMDFGKFLYEKKKKATESKKKQKVIQIKEIKMRPKIGPGDYETKMNQAFDFLEEGKHVKFTLQFRGRQPVSIQEVGNQFFERIKNDILKKELGTLMEEKETKSPSFWSKVFYIKE